MKVANTVLLVQVNALFAQQADTVLSLRLPVASARQENTQLQYPHRAQTAFQENSLIQMSRKAVPNAPLESMHRHRRCLRVQIVSLGVIRTVLVRMHARFALEVPFLVPFLQHHVPTAMVDTMPKQRSLQCA